MDIIVNPCKLSGNITAPPSKSAAHRAVICAVLASGTSEIKNIGTNDDIVASIKAAKALGASCNSSVDTLTVSGITKPPKTALIDCNESGSTLRFFTPVAAALGINATFAGKGRLPNRPMEPLFDNLKSHGVCVLPSENGIFTLSGKLQSGQYTLPGNVSSQYISGLMFALPLLGNDSKITVTSPLESSSYVDMTIDMLMKFGIKINRVKDGYYISGDQKYKPASISIEGDYSSAAFWLTAATLGNNITVSGLSPQSIQGDKAIIDILNKLSHNDHLNEISIDAGQIPDLVPILAVAGAYTSGKTKIYNASRLKIKESDRLTATADGLRRLGVDITANNDGLEIYGGTPLNGGEVDSYNDHRIAMAMTIAAIGAKDSVKIKGSECVNKSYPNFYKDFKELGGEYIVI